MLTPRYTEAMKMACAMFETVIHGYIEYVDVLLTHHFDCKRVADRRTQLCPDCAVG